METEAAEDKALLRQGLWKEGEELFCEVSLRYREGICPHTQVGRLLCSSGIRKLSR
jgi:hypothetical protein